MHSKLQWFLTSSLNNQSERHRNWSWDQTDKPSKSEEIWKGKLELDVWANHRKMTKCFNFSMTFKGLVAQQSKVPSYVALCDQCVDFPKFLCSSHLHVYSPLRKFFWFGKQWALYSHITYKKLEVENMFVKVKGNFTVVVHLYTSISQQENLVFN
jgi:hypothetical protein